MIATIKRELIDCAFFKIYNIISAVNFVIYIIQHPANAFNIIAYSTSITILRQIICLEATV